MSLTHPSSKDRPTPEPTPPEETDTDSGGAGSAAVGEAPSRWTVIGLPMWIFLPMFLLYGFWSSWEPVGSTILLLCVGLWGMTGGYLALVSRRIDPRPEDNPVAEVADGAGEYGHFSPWSWWPLVIALGVTLAFLGAAAGWWITYLGFAVGLGGLVGHVLEYNRGPHAH